MSVRDGITENFIMEDDAENVQNKVSSIVI